MSNKKSMDLMVMENLFYKQSISQTYDLKGIGAFSVFISTSVNL